VGPGNQVRGHQAGINRSTRPPIFHKLGYANVATCHFRCGSFSTDLTMPAVRRLCPQHRKSDRLREIDAKGQKQTSRGLFDHLVGARQTLLSRWSAIAGPRKASINSAWDKGDWPSVGNEQHCAFDLLELDGRDLRCEPIEKRKALLANLLRGSHVSLVYNECFEGDGEIVFREACKLGCEGIVSKRIGSSYRPGRSPHWVKVKNPRESRIKKTPALWLGSFVRKQIGR
jgi:hypothetical protein